MTSLVELPRDSSGDLFRQVGDRLGDYIADFLDRNAPRRIVEGRVADFPILDGTRYVLPPDWSGTDFRDGEWYAVISLPYEPVEVDGKVVPLFDDYGGDVERQEWERARADRRRRISRDSLRGPELGGGE